MLQLPDIAGPWITGQSSHRLGSNRVDDFIHALREILRKVPDEQRDVLGTFPQSRNPDRKHIQSIEKIASEFLLLDHRGQVAVGRRDETRIRANRPRTAQPFELSFMQHPEKLCLQLEWNISHLIEEYGSAVSQFETPDALIQRAGEGPLLMAEQFTFQKACRQGGAV